MGWEPITYCRDCGEALDVYRAPGERVCDGCAETILLEAEGAAERAHVANALSRAIFGGRS